MKLSHRVLFVSLIVATAAMVAVADGEPVTRVFWLDGMDTREAVTLLRTEVQIRQVAELRDLDALILRGDAARVERSEALLREKGGVKRVAEPHGPVALKPALGEELATRAFRVDRVDPKAVSMIMRAIYQIGDVTVSEEYGAVTARAPQPVLDAVAAMLEELDAPAD